METDPRPAPSAEERRLIRDLVDSVAEGTASGVTFDRAERDALSAYVAGLEAALAPFAALAEEERRIAYTGMIDGTSAGTPFDRSPDEALVQVYVRVGDIRAAALAQRSYGWGVGREATDLGVEP